MQLRARRTHKYTRGLVGTLVVLAVLVGASSASAKRKKIVLSEFVIEGRVQKPQAFLLLQRQSLSFEDLELRKSFVKKIVKSVDKKPF